MGEANAMQPSADGRADFDFLIGHWRVHHQILRGRLQGSTTWDEVEGTAVNTKILGGLGNLEEQSIEGKTGRVEAIAVRLFDPHAQEWRIHWADSIHPTLDAGIFGKFQQDHGEFYAQEVYEGRHVLNRFIWSAITPISARWEQALSADGGKTWEVNWVMAFSRIEAAQL